MGIADGTHVDTQQFQLGAHVGALKSTVFAGQLTDSHFCHAVAGGHQTENHAAIQGTFTDRKNVGITGATVVVDGDTAARSHLQAAISGQLVRGANSGGEHDHIGGQGFAIGKVHHQAGVLATGC